MKIQLPNDVVSRGYIQTKPYQFEQLFYSAALDMLGTEKEFVAKGYGYSYADLCRNSRRVTS